MGLNGTEYNVELHYVIRDNQSAISSTGIAPAADDATSSVDAAGNITIGKKDSAFVNFHCDTAGRSDPRIKDVGQ